MRIGVLGISRSPNASEVVTQRYSPLEAVQMGFAETWFVVERTMTYIGRIIVGRESADQLGGPIRIAQVSGQVASIGFVALLHLTAVLSISIGLLNLFPVPLLDGGHLLFYGIEAVRGRPLSERAQEMGFRIGLALVAHADDRRHLERSFASDGAVSPDKALLFPQIPIVAVRQRGHEKALGGQRGAVCKAMERLYKRSEARESAHFRCAATAKLTQAPR